ncbi:hypothetical protein [Mycobacterium branderi]|uniref:Iron-sulfur cluster biosynthesis protein n=1 Tax=Mycobacterium branderi TaxID=43348 RepID=A0A7I7W900_9MYCO|nr:hypothetical protein [Mycobacterium branderi]MCV7232104.1 Fe-S cluster assembly protein HesB [Mycobacterium branderi]ORA31521.1 hypothetical protein BST20_26645 [Mycobacterium branderi]BBZ14119.1 hypothetical protein MBRA_43140 [Mycobacterium branderi]
MLVLTPAAVEAVKAVTTAPDIPESAGLRIGPTSDGQGTLQLSAAEQPSEGDQVVEGEGARVFLEPRVAEILDDKTLDVQMDAQGVAHFLLLDQS